MALSSLTPEAFEPPCPVSARTNVKTFQSQLVASLATVVHALSMIHLDILATPPPAHAISRCAHPIAFESRAIF